MTVLMVPAAGLSTRYGLDRPKFLLQHPMGGTMLEAGLRALGSMPDLGVNELRVVTLAGFFDELSDEKLRQELEEALDVPVTIDLLPAPTASMVETLCVGMNRMEVDAAVMVKDTDNSMTFDAAAFAREGNAIAYADLQEFPGVRAHNKSYLSFGTDMALTSIIEKRITGPLFNVGCIKFASASDFLAAAKEIGTQHENFVSDVIRVLLGWGHVFRGVRVSAYEDWGTLDDWRRYTAEFRTYFVDIDGVIALNENPLSRDGGWGRYRPIVENCEALVRKQESGRARLVFTTSRSEEFRAEVEAGLSASGFKGFELLMGLPHASRVLINDFAATNPFPSARSVNLARNSATLASYID